jgi:adenylate cyclase
VIKNKLLFYIIPFLSTFLFVTLQLFDPDTIREKIEGRLYDLRLNVKEIIERKPLSQNIIIVSVDEKSIREIGRWPWSREVIAELINKISEGQPKVIGIDIMFSEEENRESDEKLAKAIEDSGNIVLATAFIVPTESENNIAEQQIREVPDFLWDAAFMEVRSVKGIPWTEGAVIPEKVNPPLEEFSKAASLGHVYTQPDLDGVLRRDIMYVYYGDDCYPSFALQVARIALGIEMMDMVLYGGSKIRLGDAFIDTDIHGRVIINYRGKEHSYDYKSASDVINGKIPSEVFYNKIIFVGTSALATYDQKVTPLSANMPGVEKNANVVENILLNNFIKKSPGPLEIIYIFITGIFLGFMLPRLRALPGAALAIGLMVFYVVLSFYLLVYENLWINITYPFSNMLIIFIAVTVTKFFFEEKKAKEIRSMFSSYVSPKIVEVLINNPEKASLGGERKVVTVLFADLMGFTSFSEKKLPEEVVDLLNEYFKEMTDIIFKWDGTLDKFVGDEIMAFWGAPADQPDHAELAVRCALDMLDSLFRMQEKWIKEGKDILDCGIGINTGEVLIGNIGAIGKKMDYTIIGDNVNLAARVEKLTRNYNAKIILTEFTKNYLESMITRELIGHYELRALEAVKVKGKEKEVQIFALKGLPHEQSQPE